MANLTKLHQTLRALARSARRVLGSPFDAEAHRVELEKIVARSANLGPYRAAIVNSTDRGRSVGSEWVVVTRNGGIVRRCASQPEARMCVAWLNRQRKS